MGWYGDQVVPRLVNATCSAATLDDLRRRTCSSLAGAVLELGFGSGSNVPFYPPAVTRVVAVEPSDVGWRLGERRREASAVPIERGGTDGARLELTGGSVDAALSTFTLCTVPDVEAALREVRRVLRPGGRLHLAEHGRAPDEAVRRWQRRLAPWQYRLAGGCHLDRPIAQLLADAGFEAHLDRFYLGAPRSFTAMYVGTAVVP